jgi:hypothetical protein
MTATSEVVERRRDVEKKNLDAEVCGLLPNKSRSSLWRVLKRRSSDTATSLCSNFDHHPV